MSKQLSISRATIVFTLVLGIVAGVVGATGVVIGMNVASNDEVEQEQTDTGIKWPSLTQLHASASVAGEGFSMATGAVDDDVEGLFILDNLTGDLRGLLLNTRTGKFNSFYSYNVVEDLGTAKVKNPKYILLTGQAAFRDGIGSPRTRLSRSAVYVAELDTGVVAAYAVPWVAGHQQFGKTTKTSFIALDRVKFRDVPLRDQ